MVDRMTGGKHLPREVLREVVNKTDGVPLFVEELTRAVMESGLLREQDGHYELTSPLNALAIPSSLNDSLMARLDRLGAAKEVAQLAATLGRDFSYELLQAVSSIDETTLQQALDKLVESEIVHQRGLLPQARYIFRHALIQDAAYQSLLRSTRQQYHKHIAQTLAERFPEIKETQPELLARHYTEAGLVAQAIPYWLQAGQQAGRRSAHVEAISHLTRGLELLSTLPDGLARAQQELALQVAMAASLLATKGFAAPEPGDAYQRALALCHQIGETPQLFPVLAGLRFFYTVAGELRTGCEIGEQLLRLAESTGDPGLTLEAHYGLGSALFYLGELDSAGAHFEKSIALYDSGQQRRFLSGIVMEAGVASRCMEAWVLWPLGYPDRALEKSREALSLAREVSHPFSLAYALTFTSAVHTWRGEGQSGQELADAAIALAREQGFPSWVAVGTFNRGYALAAQDEEEKGITQMLEGLAANRAVGARSSMTGFFSGLLPAYLKRGQTDEAAKLLAEGLELVEKDGQRYWEARLYEINGKLMRIRGNDAEAEQNFRTAIRIAQSQSTKSFELRATMSLARLLAQQGRNDEGHAMLAETYGWFTEGFDTADLKDAKALLDQLSR